MLVRRLKWFFVRPWPIWALVFVAGFAWTWTLPAQTAIVNKIIGALLQTIGAFLILFSINGNLSLYRDQNLLSMSLGWGRDWPKAGKVINLVGAAVSQANATGLLCAVRTVPPTINGRLVELERLVEELRIAMTQNKNFSLEAIENVRSDLTAVHEEQQVAIVGIASKLETATIGGVRLQIFGVGLAVLGAIISIFS